MAWEFVLKVGTMLTNAPKHNETPTSVQSTMGFISNAGEDVNGDYPFKVSRSQEYTRTNFNGGYYVITQPGTSDNFTVYNSSDTRIAAIRNQLSSTHCEKIGVGFIIDHANQQAKIWAYGDLNNNNLRRINTGDTSWTYYNTSLLYGFLTANPAIVFHWKCLDSIKGEFGQIDLAKIKEDAINNGDAVYNAPLSNFSTLPTSSKITQICTNPASRYILESNKLDSEDLNYEILRSLYCSLSTLTGILVVSDKTVTPNFTVTKSSLHRAYVAMLIDDVNRFAKWSFIYTSTESGSTYEYNTENFSTAEMQGLYTWLFGEYIPNQDNEDTGEPGEWTPRIDEPIDAPSTPTTSAIDTGFTTMYKIDDTELKKLSQFLWSDAFLDVVAKFFDDPSQAIVGLTMFPLSPNVGSSETIKPGGVATPASGYPLTSQYKDITIGSKFIKPAGYNFLDYTPYTKISVVLPYCGEHALDVNDIMGKTLELHYIFDFLTGAVIAYILVNGSMHYAFSGQCGVPIPVSQRTYDSIISGVISTGAAFGGLMATAATGGLTSAVPLTSLSASALNQMNIHPDIQYSSGGGGSTGFISSQQPFLKFEEPIPKLAPGQNAYVGRPAYNTYKIKDVSGFTKYMNIHLDGVICTEKEKEIIENYLLNGFIKRSFTTYPTITPVTSGNTSIAFFVNKSDRNVLGKDVDVQSGHYTTIEGNLVYNWSLLNPKIIVKGNFSAYNYCYIPSLSRFYFIDNITLRAKGMQELSLSVDVLETYRDQIKECSGVIERQKSITNKYFSDSYYWTQGNKQITTEKFEGENSVFDRSYNCYVLTIAGNVTSA